MTTFEQMYSFLKARYLHSRFEGMNSDWPNGVPGGGTYAELLARGALEDLIKRGKGLISHFESNSGRVIECGPNLEILNPDAPRVEISHKAGNLTHVLGH